jgi:[ribosomal protein S5]-alanine N-acetyltransferase
MPVPELTTDRLILREMLPSDAADVLTFRGDPIVQKYDDPPIHTVQEALDFIEEIRQKSVAQKSQAWGVALKESNRIIGLVGLWYWNHYHRRAEVGYGIAAAYWGQGIAQEAVKAVVRYGFEGMGLNRIYARTLVVNERSVRMLERLGFVREGTQRGYVLEDDGFFYDSALFGLVRQDWGYSNLVVAPGETTEKNWIVPDEEPG